MKIFYLIKIYFSDILRAYNFSHKIHLKNGHVYKKKKKSGGRDLNGHVSKGNTQIANEHTKGYPEILGKCKSEASSRCHSMVTKMVIKKKEKSEC